MNNPSLRRLLLSTALGFVLALPLASGAVRAESQPAAVTETQPTPAVDQVALPEITQSDGVSHFTLPNGLKWSSFPIIALQS